MTNSASVGCELFPSSLERAFDSNVVHDTCAWEGESREDSQVIKNARAAEAMGRGELSNRRLNTGLENTA